MQDFQQPDRIYRTLHTRTLSPTQRDEGDEVGPFDEFISPWNLHSGAIEYRPQNIPVITS